MTYDDIAALLRLKILGRDTARLKSIGERLEAKIEQLTQERDRLHAEIAAIEASRPSKLET